MGIKIYPNVFGNSNFIKKIKPILQSIESNKWIIQIHSNPIVKPDIGILLYIVKFAYETDLPTVIVHSGGHQFQQLSSWINHPPENLYFDTSVIQNIFDDSPYSSHLKWFLNKIPQGHLFWGSDFPDYSFKKALNSFKKLKLDKSRIDNILSKNIINFLSKNTSIDLEILS